MQRNRTNRFQVFGDIFPHKSIATGRATGEDTVGIFQRNRKPVDFWLYHKFRIGKLLFAASQKRRYFCKRKDILQAHHLDGMLHLFKGTGCHTTYPLGRRGRQLQRGKRCFQFPQLPHHLIIRKIRNGRVIQYIIPIIMGFQFFGKLRNPFFGCCKFHGSSFLPVVDSAVFHYTTQRLKIQPDIRFFFQRRDICFLCPVIIP
ncbi:unknown [Ruminococcus sp. CAG:254]|nr:unknown [Ruminococcus sp. CAG:254]